MAIKRRIKQFASDLESVPLVKLRKRLFLIVFAYVCLCSAVVQFIVLPHIIPQHHEGAGIFEGIDTSGFHTKAINATDAAQKDGLTGFIDKFPHHPPAKILAVIYLLFGEKFYNAIPFNAAVHGMTCLILFNIMLYVFRSRFFALLGVLPFTFLPYSSLWYTQMHKDGVFILGFYCLFWGLSRLDRDLNIGTLLLNIGIGLCGVTFAWFMRPYILDPMIAAAFLGMALTTAHLFVSRHWQRALSLYLFFGAIIFYSSYMRRTSQAEEIIMTKAAEQVVKVHQDSRLPGPATPNKAKENRSLQVQQADTVTTTTQNEPRKQSRLEAMLVHKLNILMTMRRGLAYDSRHGTTNVDADIIPASVTEFFLFVPRAVLNGLMAPYPTQLLNPAQNGFRTFLKKLVLAETAFAYLALVFAGVFFVTNFAKLHLHFLLAGCLTFTTLYGFVFVNSGTLYRMRYGFMMLLVGIGFSAASKLYLYADRNILSHISERLVASFRRDTSVTSHD